MRIKLLAVLALSAFLFLTGCKGSETNTNANANAKPSPTAVPKSTETPKADSATVKKIEDALKAKGFTDVTVDGSGPKIVLRGTVAKDKMATLMQTVQEAGGTAIDNQVQGK